MKKILAYVFSLVFLLLPVVSSPITVKAATLHDMSLKAIDYNLIDDTGSGQAIENNGQVAPGQVIGVTIHYTPVAPERGLQSALLYDNTKVEPLHEVIDEETGEEEAVVDWDPSTTYQGGMWPAAGTTGAAKNRTNWNVLFHDAAQYQQITFLIMDSTNNTSVNTEGDIATVYFKIKDNVENGDSVHFEVDKSYTFSNSGTKFTTGSIDFTVATNVSSNNDVKDFKVKYGDTSFEVTKREDAEKGQVYEVIVPNYANTVNFEVTPDDENALVAGDGSKTIAVGDNNLEFTITAQNGETAVYPVYIKRLDNTAKLDSLTLSGIDIGTFNPNTTTYSATVPFSTKTTTVRATTSGNSLVEGTDSYQNTWTLTSSGSTVNTLQITVDAEDCLYPGIESNVCTQKTYTINITREAASTNNKLASLKVDGTLVDGFDPTITTYNLPDVANNKTTIKIEATAEDLNATVSGTGTKNLSVGVNSFVVSVKSESGATKKYTVNVKRLSNDASLKELTITSDDTGSLSPSFSKDIKEYTYTASAESNSVTVSALTNHENATIVSGTGTFDLSTVSKTEIMVTAEDGSTDTYIINFERTKSTNSKLMSLSVDGYELNETFNSDVFDYTLNVSGNVESINIGAKVADSRATITSGTGSKDLLIGTNNFKVIVTAEDNTTTSTYNLVVTRAKKTTSTLSSLTVDGVSVPGFNPNTYEYTLDNVSNDVTSVNVGATLTDSDSTISGTGVKGLAVGANKLTVTVTAQDGVTKTSYIINVSRDKNSNAYLSFIKTNDALIDNFDKDTLEYNLTVTNNVSSLDAMMLTYAPEVSTTTVSVTGNTGFSTLEVNVIKLKATAEAGNELEYVLNITREKNDNNYLKAIEIFGYELTPEFDKEVTSYTVHVDRDINKLNFQANPEEATSKVDISGPSTIELGNNTYNITVTSEKGNNRNYELVVVKDKATNNYLSDIKINNESIAFFDKETLEYTVYTDSTAKEFKIEGILEDDKYATITGNGTYILNSGKNEFNLVVKAENKDERTYKVIINRAISSDSTLKTLSVKDASLNPSFNKYTTEYSVTVPYETKEAVVSATPSIDSSSVVGAGEYTLVTGNNVIEVEVTAEDGVSKTTYTINLTREKNNNAKLTDLVVSGNRELTPTFDSTKYNYTLNVTNDITSLNLKAYAEDTNATITGDGDITLNTGLNTVEIKVTAEDEVTTQTYVVEITRDKNSDNTLKSLEVSNGLLDPEFDKNVKDYSIKIPNEVKNVTVTAIPTVTTSKAIVSGNTNLVVGNNEILVTVTAENGEMTVYKINAERQKSANNFLKSLSIKDSSNNEYITSFNRTITEYEIVVPNSVTAVAVNGIPEDTNSTVEGNTTSFDLGEAGIERTINVVVTSQSNIERVYTVKVTREISVNNFLSDLKVDGHSITPEFAKDVYEYTLDVDSTYDKVNIIATKDDETSTVSGDGEKSLVTGANIFEILVTAQSTDVRKYQITINKAASENNNLANITLSDGTLNPAFSKDITKYNVSLDNSISVIEIDATLEDKRASLSGTGIKSIPVGSSSYELEVIAENGTKKVYVINVDRAKSNNNYLTDLALDGTTISGFNKNITEYKVDVPNDKIKVNIGATLEDDNATLSGTGEYNLVTGENTIEVKVTAEDDSVKTYKVIIDRAKSDNNFLSKLDVVEGSLLPEFDKNQNTYSITIPNEYESLTLDYDTESSVSTVEVIGNENFVVGDNEVSLVVTSEFGTDRTYVIKVTRQPEANNYLTDLKVYNADGNELEFDKAFSKDELSYTIEITNDVTKVNIDATLESSYSTISGVGEVTIGELPQTQNVVVTTFDGIDRTYKINFVKKLSDNADILSLEVIPGGMDPIFDKDTTNYNVSVPTGTTEIEISAIKGEPNQEITGTGTFSVHKGENKFTVSVTSESGTFKYYFLTVNVDTDENVLTKLSVDKGTLTPEFDPDKNVYSVEVSSDDDKISINAEGKNTITNTGEHELTEGANVIDIISTDDTGNKNIYTVAVYKGHVVSPYLSYLRIGKYSLDKDFDKLVPDYNVNVEDVITSVDVVAIPEDQNAVVSITGNDNLTPGNNEITITVTDEENNTVEYKVNVVLGLTKIMSDIHTLTDDYALTISEGEIVSKVKDEMINPNENLKVYNLDGDEASEDEAVGTGYIIKLVINGIVYDSKVLIIKGDLNGDGEIGVADIIKIRLHILESQLLNDYEVVAADTNDDTDIGVADLIQIRSHILGSLNLFERVSD